MAKMFKVEAIIKPLKMHQVKDALDEAGFPSLTIIDVKGRGQQKGIVQQWRGKEYCVDLLPKTKIEVVVAEDKVEEIIQLIQSTAYTGEIGDGKIFVIPIETVVRIRTGERNGDAL
ncbi:Nitrogen regulatory protein P-II [Methanosarcina lacustris Z-7289]|uniref:Nitrogen regulatory protein P-II n=1 Tax=Methanosarcina lacustris Z-7289 TaxID=1434111 RepID=A0A0E3WT44_9EURY|nr:P-II family nitrogen regulator [Methanosarcina lacustris]AKB75955.1 Nitrogen regulatory protein P-II [Methanosarcina lacustris Z-7289]